MDKKRVIMIGVMIFTILELILCIFINTNLYKGVFNTGILVPILVLQVVFTYNFLRDRLKTKWPKLWVSIFLSISIILFVVGKPTYTFKQAEKLVMEEYGHDITILDNGKDNYRDTVPIYTEEYRFFIRDRDYHFKGVDKTKEYRYFLVNPRTGKVSEMSQPYWHGS